MMYPDLSDLFAEANAEEIKAVKEEAYCERQETARRLHEEGFNEDRISYLMNASLAEVKRMQSC